MEIWDAYDEHRNLIPHVLLERTAFPYPEGFYHLAVNIWVQHEDGDWLFMRRSSQKSHYPGVYELGAGGSVHQGESSLDAAKRELLEETGLAAEQMDFLFSFTEKEHLTHFDTYLVTVSCDKDALSYQAGETDAHCWVTPDEIERFLVEQPVFKNQRQQLLGYLGKESD